MLQNLILAMWYNLQANVSANGLWFLTYKTDY